MTGLYLIALIGPLVVFGPFVFAINRLAKSNPKIIANKERALGLYVALPIAISYGLVVVAAAALFVSYLFTL